MKKIYFLFVVLFVAKFAISQTAFIEKFQGGTMPTTFTLINDNNTPHANIAALFPNAWDVQGEPDDTLNKVAASPSWFTAVAPADRWMITPAITVTAGMTLSWAGKGQDPAYLDGYQVKISQTGKNKADFVTMAANVTAETETWSSRNYNLSAFAGKTIYVAFIQNSTDMFYVMIDDIRVGVGTGVEETTNVASTVAISPNPAKDQLNLNSTSTINNVKIVNSLGQVVLDQVINNNKVSLDISTFEAGVYFVTSTTEKGTYTEKVVVL
jgi:hypothetical protein